MGKVEKPTEQKENFNLSKRELKRRIDYLDTEMQKIIAIIDEIANDLNRVMDRMGL